MTVTTLWRRGPLFWPQKHTLLCRPSKTTLQTSLSAEEGPGGQNAAQWMELCCWVSVIIFQNVDVLNFFLIIIIFILCVTAGIMSVFTEQNNGSLYNFSKLKKSRKWLKVCLLYIFSLQSWIVQSFVCLGSRDHLLSNLTLLWCVLFLSVGHSLRWWYRFRVWHERLRLLFVPWGVTRHAAAPQAHQAPSGQVSCRPRGEKHTKALAVGH